MSTIYRLLDAASPAVFAFGALTFSTLAVFYLGARRRQAQKKQTVFLVFTLACAVSFLINLLPHSVALTIAGRLAVGLLPGLILHVVLGSRWRFVPPVFYAAAILGQAGMIIAPWSDLLYRVPAAELALASLTGLLFLALSPRPPRGAERNHRLWIASLLASMLLCALASLNDSGAWVDQLADYVLLAFFSVSLYYRERLVFFDVLMKRGIYLGLGLTVLAIAAGILLAPRDAPVVYGLGMLIWLAAPLVFSLVGRTVDRLFLRRPWTPDEAERRFSREVQSAASEEELRTHAAQSLSAIFQAPAQVRFDSIAAHEEDGLLAEIEYEGARRGAIVMGPRPGGAPYLSDDRRLLRSLAVALGLVLENLRFRADRLRHQQREQELLLLASRSELKALRAQINPHFLFNSLSVIAGLMQYQPELADETIERLAQVFRYTLRKSENEWSPLGEEIEFIAAYLGIEQARFGERLQVEFDVDPAAAQIPIPAMSIQPLVENAIKHGVSAHEGPGTVRVRASLEDDRLSVEVCDTGPGFPPGFSLRQRGESHGLSNVASRLHGYYGDSARLSWHCDTHGTRVAIALPAPAVVCGEPA